MKCVRSFLFLGKIFVLGIITVHLCAGPALAAVACTKESAAVRKATGKYTAAARKREAFERRIAAAKKQKTNILNSIARQKEARRKQKAKLEDIQDGLIASGIFGSKLTCTPLIKLINPRLCQRVPNNLANAVNLYKNNEKRIDSIKRKMNKLDDKAAVMSARFDAKIERFTNGETDPTTGEVTFRGLAQALVTEDERKAELDDAQADLLACQSPVSTPTPTI